MPEIKNPDRFQPDGDALKLWLSTRKRPIDCGDQTLPGFYQTAGFGTDSSWFLLAFCVEVAAVVLTLYGGWSEGGTFLIGSIIVVVLFILFDIVGTVLFHKPMSDRCLIRNKIFITHDPKKKEKLRDELKKGTLWQVLGAILIILSAAFKIMAILLLGAFDMKFYVIMSLLYLIVIYVHLNHTGYFFAERKTNKLFKKQYNRWKYSKKDAEVAERVFSSKVKLNLSSNGDISIGQHKIVPVESSSDSSDLEGGEYYYKLQTKGILTDDDIKRLTVAVAQSPEQAGKIAIECLKHQF